MNACHVPTASIFLDVVYHAHASRYTICVNPKAVVLALRSIALSVMKGGGQNLNVGSPSELEDCSWGQTLGKAIILVKRAGPIKH